MRFSLLSPVYAAIAVCICLLTSASSAAPVQEEEWIQFSKRATLTPNFAGKGTKTIRGVNLGGWFVLEAWMSPSLFTADLVARGAVDQWTYMTAVSNNNLALSLLQAHWNTWITEADFQAIAAAGLNTVRIPVGHWTFNATASEPYLAGAELPFISRALVWAAKYKLDVLLDLHTAPGSQSECIAATGE